MVQLDERGDAVVCGAVGDPFQVQPYVGLLLVAALVAPAGAAHAATGPVMYPRGIGADLGPDVTALGVTVRGGDDPAGLRIGTLDGRTYWQTQVAAGTTYVGVTPDAGYASSVTGASIVVVVTYHDAGSGQLTLRTASGDTKTVAELAGTNAWRLAAVGLDGAALGGGELRLAGVAGGTPADITVAQVRITRTGPQATLGPTATDTGLSPRAGDNEAGLVTGTIAGRGFWRTNATAPPPATNYLYMNVADSYAYNTSDIVMVSVDYLDAGNGSVICHDQAGGHEDLGKEPGGHQQQEQETRDPGCGALVRLSEHRVPLVLGPGGPDRHATIVRERGRGLIATWAGLRPADGGRRKSYFGRLKRPYTSAASRTASRAASWPMTAGRGR